MVCIVYLILSYARVSFDYSAIRLPPHLPFLGTERASRFPHSTTYTSTPHVHDPTNRVVSDRFGKTKGCVPLGYIGQTGPVGIHISATLGVEATTLYYTCQKKATQQQTSKKRKKESFHIRFPHATGATAYTLGISFQPTCAYDSSR